MLVGTAVLLTLVRLNTVNSEMFARILFSRIALGDIFATSKFVTRPWFIYISKRQSNFAIWRGFYFHETSHMRIFAEIKFSRKFPNLQYINVLHNFNLLTSNILVVSMFSQIEWKTVCILIRWLRQKPADLDLQCFKT